MMPLISRLTPKELLMPLVTKKNFSDKDFLFVMSHLVVVFTRKWIDTIFANFTLKLTR